jgi:hypothetical protein
MENGTNKSRGRIVVERLFTADEIGISLPEPHPTRALRIFLDIASPAECDAIALRSIHMPKGVLLLETASDNPSGGAIYIYDREAGDFYIVTFDGDESDHFTVRQFEELVGEYDLLRYASCPALLKAPVQTPGAA